MQGVMVDTSVWVAYFRGGDGTDTIANALDYLLAGDEAVTNEIILTELLPFMRIRREKDAETALLALPNPEFSINWQELRGLQEKCLRDGVNNVGIPDLAIALHAKNLGVPLFSLDRHFKLIAPLCGLSLWPEESGATAR